MTTPVLELEELQVIRASAGAAVFTWPVIYTENTGKNVTAATVTAGITTSSTTPPTFAAATVTRPAANVISVQWLVPSSTSPGTYYLWVKIVDNTETIVWCAMQFQVI